MYVNQWPNEKVLCVTPPPLYLVNHDLHWLKILISVVERPDNGFRIHHHHVFIGSTFRFSLDRFLASQTSPRVFVNSVGVLTQPRSRSRLEVTIDRLRPLLTTLGNNIQVII